MVDITAKNDNFFFVKIANVPTVHRSIENEVLYKIVPPTPAKAFLHAREMG